MQPRGVTVSRGHSKQFCSGAEGERIDHANDQGGRSRPICIQTTPATKKAANDRETILRRLAARAESARRARIAVNKRWSSFASSSSVSSCGSSSCSDDENSENAPQAAPRRLSEVGRPAGCVLTGCINCGDPFLGGDSQEALEGFCSGECLLSHSCRSSMRRKGNGAP